MKTFMYKLSVIQSPIAAPLSTTKKAKQSAGSGHGGGGATDIKAEGHQAL